MLWKDILFRYLSEIIEKIFKPSFSSSAEAIRSVFCPISCLSRVTSAPASSISKGSRKLKLSLMAKPEEITSSTIRTLPFGAAHINEPPSP